MFLFLIFQFASNFLSFEVSFRFKRFDLHHLKKLKKFHSKCLSKPTDRKFESFELVMPFEILKEISREKFRYENVKFDLKPLVEGDSHDLRLTRLNLDLSSQRN